MAKIIISTDKTPKSPATCSQAVKAGGFVFVAEQGPFDPSTGTERISNEGDKSKTVNTVK